MKTLTLLETENSARYTHLLTDVPTRKIETDVLSELSKKRVQREIPGQKHMQSVTVLTGFPRKWRNPSSERMEWGML